jgi:hypothetical protein
MCSKGPTFAWTRVQAAVTLTEAAYASSHLFALLFLRIPKSRPMMDEADNLNESMYCKVLCALRVQ